MVIFFGKAETDSEFKERAAKLKKPKKLKKPSRRSLLRQWGQLILRRDKRICQKCGKRGNNPHHIFTRARNSTAFLPENGITLCTHCHIWDTDEGAHPAPEEFKAWLLKNWMTEKEYEDLKLSSHLTEKFDPLAIKLFLDKEKKKQEVKP